MLRFMRHLLMDKADAAGGGGTPPAAEPPAEPNPPPDNPPAAEGGDKFDEFGYEKPAAAKGEKKEEGAKPPENPLEKEVEKPATGYGAKPPKVEDAPAAPPAEPPAKDELDPLVEGLPQEEVTKVKAFATTHKLTPDQVKAYAELRKSDISAGAAARDASAKEAEREVAKLKAGWDKELRDDKDFGGANFVKSVNRVDRVLEDFLPQTKKALTERGSMLPPYVMRDLAKLADHLYKTEKLVQGDPVVEVKEEDKETDPLDFYKS